jgi:hypothetical protein
MDLDKKVEGYLEGYFKRKDIVLTKEQREKMMDAISSVVKDIAYEYFTHVGYDKIKGHQEYIKGYSDGLNVMCYIIDQFTLSEEEIEKYSLENNTE